VIFVKTFYFSVKTKNRKKLFELVRGMSSIFLTIEKDLLHYLSSPNNDHINKSFREYHAKESVELTWLLFEG
jgi:hypothetical protein